MSMGRSLVCLLGVLSLVGCTTPPPEPEREFGSGLDSVPVSHWRGYPIKAQAVESKELGDADGDGVVDARDECQGTQRGVVIANTGCAYGLSKVLEFKIQVNFASGKTNINKKYDDEIAELAKKLKDHPAAFLLIEGHTDNVGGRVYNKDLSIRRARAVALRLMNQYSIDESRILVSGRGFDYPVATNDTSDGRAKNRRMIAYFAQQDRMQKLQWNVWTVELKKNEEDRANRRDFQRVFSGGVQ